MKFCQVGTKENNCHFSSKKKKPKQCAGTPGRRDSGEFCSNLSTIPLTQQRFVDCFATRRVGATGLIFLSRYKNGAERKNENKYLIAERKSGKPPIGMHSAHTTTNTLVQWRKGICTPTSPLLQCTRSCMSHRSINPISPTSCNLNCLVLWSVAVSWTSCVVRARFLCSANECDFGAPCLRRRHSSMGRFCNKRWRYKRGLKFF